MLMYIFYFVQRQCITKTQTSLNALNKRKTQLDTTIKSHRAQLERKEKEITGESIQSVIK